MFAALGLLRRRQSRPPLNEAPSPPDSVAGVLRFLRLTSRKRARVDSEQEAVGEFVTAAPEEAAPAVAVAVGGGGGGGASCAIPGALLEALGALTRRSKRGRGQPVAHVYACNPDD